jgi:AraC-like DNA-binding protein
MQGVPGQPSITVLVRGTGNPLARPALAALRLITRQFQAEYEAALARSALQQAQFRIQSLEQRLLGGSGSGRQPLPGEPNHRAVEAMKQFAQAHGHRPIQLQDVASELNMNASYLCGLFSKCTGTTFHDYLETLRIRNARELLRDPARRIKEVAFSVGFCSAAHFCRVFKARTGVSPLAWSQAMTMADLPASIARPWAHEVPPRGRG